MVSLLWYSGLTAQIMDDYINVVLLELRDSTLSCGRVNTSFTVAECLVVCCY